jgi:hypothetical protein
MDSNPRRRGLQIAERNINRHADDLAEWLTGNRERARDGIRQWMRMAFHRGVEYGKRVSKRGVPNAESRR